MSEHLRMNILFLSLSSSPSTSQFRLKSNLKWKQQLQQQQRFFAYKINWLTLKKELVTLLVPYYHKKLNLKNLSFINRPKIECWLLKNVVFKSRISNFTCILHCHEHFFIQIGNYIQTMQQKVIYCLLW